MSAETELAAIGSSPISGHHVALEIQREARQALVGHCLATHTVPDWPPRVFEGFSEAYIYAAARDLATEAAPVDMASVLERLLLTGKIVTNENPAGKFTAGLVFECLQAWDRSAGNVDWLLSIAGADLDAAHRIAPFLDLTEPVGAMAESLGGLLARTSLFLRAGQIVTVDEATGDVKPMTAERFCTWVEQWVTPYRPDRSGAQRLTTMGKDMAGKILASDQFVTRLRPLAEVNPVRLPVRRESGAIELLAPGYDREAQVWTHDGLEYPDDMDIDDAREWITSLLAEWPWSEAGAAGTQRSAAVQVAAMVGMYCRQVFPAGTHRPLLCYIGNQPGTGKSTLAAMALAPVFGTAATTDLPGSKEELRKALDSKAEAYAPYIWFDDIGGGIYSNALNRFVTASRHSGRRLGSSDQFDVPNVSQVLATGNGIRLTPDLARRSLVVDLFVAGEIRGRKFKQTISESWLARDDIRAKTLAALWAAVRAWGEAGEQPGTSAPMESFELWTGTVAAIVQDFGFADPLEAPDLSMGGDEEGEDFRRLLTSLADDFGPEEDKREFRRGDLVDRARELGVLEELVGIDGDKDLAGAEAKAFGRRLAKWKGREFPTADGRVFEFGSRHARSGTVYPCRVWAP